MHGSSEPPNKRRKKNGKKTAVGKENIAPAAQPNTLRRSSRLASKQNNGHGIKITTKQSKSNTKTKTKSKKTLPSESAKSIQQKKKVIYKPLPRPRNARVSLSTFNPRNANFTLNFKLGNIFICTINNKQQIIKKSECYFGCFRCFLF